MRIKACIWIVGLFLGIGVLHAQHLVQVSGFIWARGDSTITIPYAGLMNKRTKRGTQSTHEGFYTILVAPGDSVEITAIGYQRITLALPLGFTGTSFTKNIYLHPTVYTLNTFNVKDKMDWDKFKDAFVSMEVPQEKKYVTIDPNAITSSAPARTTFGYTLNGPLTWLYNKVGKKAKEQNKLDELRSGEDEDMASTMRITNEYIMELTKLPEDKIKEFLDYCPADNQFYAKASEYDVRNHFLACVPGFREKFGIPEPPPPVNAAPDSTSGNPR